MEKIQTYKYEKSGVRLEFSFTEGPEIATQKMIFRELMIGAIADLAMELNLNQK